MASRSPQSPKGSDEDLDFDALSEVLAVLSNANRLRLLAQLRQPRMVSEIRLSPESVSEGENPARTMSRQAVHLHLEKLLAIGAVISRATRDHAASGDEYVVNHQQIFAMSEEFRKLGELRPQDDGWELRTQSLADIRRIEANEGPRMVLVHGLGEGTVFPLVSDPAQATARWLLGRRLDAEVSLDYDPYVSAENSRIGFTAGRGYWIEDLPGSRNGTFVNWRRVPSGQQGPLEHGDIVGVGKTLLVFRQR